MKTILTITLTLFFSTLSMASTHTSQELTDRSENLIEAVSNIDLISLNVLLSEGANIDTVDQNGNTPLMIAAKIGNPRIVRILLAHDPDIEKKNSEGNTALMIAAEHGQTFVVEQLIGKGASLNVKNRKGFTPMEIARRNGHAAVVNVLNNEHVTPLSR